jgi:hypothetical protein
MVNGSTPRWYSWDYYRRPAGTPALKEFKNWLPDVLRPGSGIKMNDAAPL